MSSLVCAPICVCPCVDACVCIRICMYVFVYMYACVSVCMYVYVVKYQYGLWLTSVQVKERVHLRSNPGRDRVRVTVER